MAEKIRGAFYDEQPEPQALRTRCVSPVKSPKNLAQLRAGDADAAVAHFDAHLRTAPAGTDQDRPPRGV